RDLWEKIGVPKGSVGSSIEDDGNAPSTASSLNHSGGNLSWNKSGSHDVVGYRIYKASESGGSFSKVGSTTSTSYSTDGSGVYHVKAVDYFGRESGASNEITVGDLSDSNKNEEKKDKNKKEDTKEKNKDKDNKKDKDEKKEKDEEKDKNDKKKKEKKKEKNKKEDTKEKNKDKDNKKDKDEKKEKDEEKDKDKENENDDNNDEDEADEDESDD